MKFIPSRCIRAMMSRTRFRSDIALCSQKRQIRAFHPVTFSSADFRVLYPKPAHKFDSSALLRLGGTSCQKDPEIWTVLVSLHELKILLTQLVHNLLDGLYFQNILPCRSHGISDSSAPTSRKRAQLRTNSMSCGPVGPSRCFAMIRRVFETSSKSTGCSSNTI